MNKTGKSGPRKARIPALLLALLLFAFSPAGALGARLRADADLIIAQNAVIALRLTDENGEFLSPYKAPETPGRGKAGEDGAETDYRGVVGYMAMDNGPELVNFTTFGHTPWQLPVYSREGEDWTVTDAITHKTPVLVVDQALEDAGDGTWRGYLQVVRLDRQALVWVDVAEFVTLPYWTLPLSEAVAYGCCMAHYQNRSRCEPLNPKGYRGPLPDGVRVLVCSAEAVNGVSPEPGGNPMLALLFVDGEETGRLLFFHPDDLTLVY